MLSQKVHARATLPLFHIWSILDLLFCMMTYTTICHNSSSGAPNTRPIKPVTDTVPGTPIDLIFLEAYILKCMDTIIGGGLLSYFKDQFKHEILAGISTLSDSVLEKWVDAIEATVKNQCIGVQALHGMGTSAEDILRDNVWMLYHPCVTTKWRDEETANRFQEFVRRIQGQEQAKARTSQHAGAKRRRELLERACTD